MKCKELAITGAQWAKESYAYSKEAYLATNSVLAERNIDSSVFCIKRSIESIDSCIGLAPDSNFLALQFSRLAKKKAAYSLAHLIAYQTEERKNRKREFAWEAVSSSQQTVLDAYHASFYFEGVKEKEPEKKPDTLTTTPAEKKITKLDVDQALFVMLNEQLHEKSDKRQKEIDKLKEKLKITKDPAATKKIKDQLKKLEEEENTIVKKNMEASEQLSKINGLIEERDKRTGQVKNEETVFAKGLPKTPDEWNKQVLGNSDLPQGLVYQVQIGVYKSAIVPEIFKGLTPIFKTEMPGGIMYSTGIFTKASDAQEAKAYVKSMGLADAFVTAYYNRKKITLAEAAKLEKK